MSDRKDLGRRLSATKTASIVLAVVTFFVGQTLLCSTEAQEAVAPQPVDFTLLGVDGKPLKLSSYRGRWVILNFWATWCAPCLREIPELTWFHDKYNARAIVIGVNYESIDTRSLRNFIAKHDIGYPVVRIGGEPLLPFEPLVGLPSTFFVSPKGDYVARHTGVITARDIERYIKKNSSESAYMTRLSDKLGVDIDRTKPLM